MLFVVYIVAAKVLVPRLKFYLTILSDLQLNVNVFTAITKYICLYV